MNTLFGEFWNVPRGLQAGICSKQKVVLKRGPSVFCLVAEGHRVAEAVFPLHLFCRRLEDESVIMQTERDSDSGRSLSTPCERREEGRK